MGTEAEENHDSDEILGQYNNLKLAIKSNLINFRKIRPETVEPGIIKRPYIEIIIDPKIEDTLYNKLSKIYIVGLRNYVKKTFTDNLDEMDSIPIDKKCNIPNVPIDLFSVKLFKETGEYGIGIRFTRDCLRLLDEESFFDTFDIRDIVNAKKFPTKTSMLIFAKSVKQGIPNLLSDLNDIFTQKKKIVVKSRSSGGKVKSTLKKRILSRKIPHKKSSRRMVKNAQK
jgi:hypothetical protein